MGTFIDHPSKIYKALDNNNRGDEEERWVNECANSRE